jgi:hypothetical protein
MFLFALSSVSSINLTQGFYHATLNSNTNYSFNIPSLTEAYIMTSKQLDWRTSVTLIINSTYKQYNPLSFSKFNDFKINTSQFLLNFPDSTDIQIWVVDADLCSSVEYSWNIQLSSRLNFSFYNQLCLFLPFYHHQNLRIQLKSNSDVGIFNSNSFQHGTDFTLYSPFFVFLSEPTNDSLQLTIDSDNYEHTLGSCDLQPFSYFDFDKGFQYQADSTQLNILTQECKLNELAAWIIVFIVIVSVFMLILIVSVILCCCCCGCCLCCCRRNKKVEVHKYYHSTIPSTNVAHHQYTDIPHVVYPNY